MEENPVAAVRQGSARPHTLPGIYNTCDQWCMYCPATGRCLAFRCRPEEGAAESSDDIFANIAARMFDGLKMLRDLNAAEGRKIPELESLLSEEPRQWRSVLQPVDDPLEKMGRRYAMLSSRYLMSHPSFPFEMRRRDEGPTPFEVFAWYHVLIAAKISRAITSSGSAVRTRDRQLHEDALFSAKVALIGIRRSQEALADLQEEDDDVRLDEMQTHLRRLSGELAARFPEAQSIVRPGLDNEGPRLPG